ncbi:ArsA family ATPase [Suttonella sp. R2A3]|uniref:ArsA family ATPase n=1 Tax=Suttonella sp. R2A3 TaxID=2908648 RepID=UPI001F2E9645|nr:ArsA family ATPase [Suttonella sp. R2A3]UJF24413.1 ArsA family ATPase [Suttonella sp. R2A3]
MGLLQTLDAHSVIFVGGKGGVGKTTSAAALAVHFAQQKRKTLIISTDPAHSLGDAFATKLSHEATTIDDYLTAIELDPNRLIHQHFAQIERTLAAYTNPDMMPKLREFLKLSHHAPGAEEAAMLEAICRELIHARAEGYDKIIFDTAPTGHTLRLLSLPEMMQAWTDGLLAQQRRQSKLRGAAEALDFPNPLQSAHEDRWGSAVRVLEKRRALFAEARDILHDPSQTAIVLVLIPEHLPLLETQRAVQQLASVDLPCAGLFINQVIDSEQNDAFWQQRADRQRQILQDIDAHFADIEKMHVHLHSNDVRGVQALAGFWSQRVS